MFANPVSLARAASEVATCVVVPDSSIVGSPTVAAIGGEGYPQEKRSLNLRYVDGVYLSIVPVAAYSGGPWDMDRSQAEWKAKLHAEQAVGGGYDDGRDSPFDIVVISGARVAVWRPGNYSVSKKYKKTAVAGKIGFVHNGAEYWINSENPGVTLGRLEDFVKAVLKAH